MDQDYPIRKERDKLSTGLLILFLIVLTVILSFVVYIEKTPLSTLFFGSVSLTHWFSYIGGLWIAVITPIFYFLKWRKPVLMKPLLRLHVFGNLIAFTLISMHFVTMESGAKFLGTGLTLYIAVFTLVASGIIRGLNLFRANTKQVRFIHASMAMAFYLVLIVHILGTFILL